MNNKKKISFDTDTTTYGKLCEFAELHKTTAGATINGFIDIFLNMRSDVSQKILNLCNREISGINARIAQTAEFERSELLAECDQFRQIRSMLSRNDLTLIQQLEERNMRIVRLRQGFVCFPSDWIVLEDFAKPEDCMYAGVVSVHNGEQFHAPYFVFFSNKKYGCDYTRQEEENIYRLCEKKFPKIREILESETDAVFDENGRVINGGEYMASPRVCLYNIWEKNDPVYKAAGDPPFGCQIYRDDISGE